MAREASKTCAGIHIDLCFCSPLIRARETAQIVLEGRDVPIQVDARLTEMCFGIYEGTEDIAGAPVSVIFRHPEAYVTPFEGAESFDALYKRTGDFLKSVIRPLLARGLDVLIVGHGAVNCCIICQIRGLPIESFWSAGMKNCELVRLI